MNFSDKIIEKLRAAIAKDGDLDRFTVMLTNKT